MIGFVLSEDMRMVIFMYGSRMGIDLFTITAHDLKTHLMNLHFSKLARPATLNNTIIVATKLESPRYLSEDLCSIQ